MADIVWNKDEIDWLEGHKDQINKVETPEEFKKFYTNLHCRVEGLDNLMGMIFLAEKFNFEYSWINVKCSEINQEPKVRYEFVGGENINIFGRDVRFGNFGFLGFLGDTGIVCGHLRTEMRFYSEHEGMVGPGDSIVYPHVKNQIEYFYDLFSSTRNMWSRGVNLISNRDGYLIRRGKDYILNNLDKFKISVTMV